MALLADTPVSLPVTTPADETYTLARDAAARAIAAAAHSPPSATPSSYGNNMPKRARAGSGPRSRAQSIDQAPSLTSRLRAASELERAGLVTGPQKGALRDLVMSGDEALRGALDDYHAGDAAQLERLVKQGYLDRVAKAAEGRPREGSIDLLAELDLDSTAEVLFAARRPPPSAELYGHDDQLMGFDMEMPSLASGLLGDDDLFSERKRRARLGSICSFGSANSDAGDEPRRPRCDSVASLVSEPDRAVVPPPRQQRTAARHALQAAPKRRSRRDDRARPATDAHPGPDQPVARYRGVVAATVADPPGARLLDPGPAPAYELLVNFPRAKSRSQIHCVMCGRRPRDANPREPPPECAACQPRLQRLAPGGDARDDVARGEERHLGGSVIIPRQNKDVCRECDKALWRHRASDVHFKWCKGCKRFRNLVAFAEKLAASKCDRCRERGRQGYMRRKGGGPSPPCSPR